MASKIAPIRDNSKAIDDLFFRRGHDCDGADAAHPFLLSSNSLKKVVESFRRVSRLFEIGPHAILFPRRP